MLSLRLSSPELMFLKSFLLLNLPDDHLSHIGKQVAALSIKDAGLLVNDAAATRMHALKSGIV